MAKTNENSRSDPNRLRGRIVKTLAMVALAGFGVRAYDNAHNYGYHPSKNPPAPTYLQKYDGINPSDLQPDSSGK